MAHGGTSKVTKLAVKEKRKKRLNWVGVAFPVSRYRDVAFSEARLGRSAP